MMSTYGANPIFFNKKNKDWTSTSLSTLFTPTSDNISFLPYLPPPIPAPFKWTSYVCLRTPAFDFDNCIVKGNYTIEASLVKLLATPVQFLFSAC